jgi:hypothetical protein
VGRPVLIISLPIAARAIVSPGGARGALAAKMCNVF